MNPWKTYTIEVGPGAALSVNWKECQTTARSPYHAAKRFLDEVKLPRVTVVASDGRSWSFRKKFNFTKLKPEIFQWNNDWRKR